MHVGQSDIDLDWHSDNGTFTLDVRSNGPQFLLRWTQEKPGNHALGPTHN
jgi:hypothetical protein